jgi:uncharacterized protein YbbC (DUF1343 family)
MRIQNLPASRESLTWLPLLFFLFVGSITVHAQVTPGVDVIVAEDFAPVAGKRVGLVMNPTAVRRDPTQTTLEVFLATDRCRLAAVFAPEHGFDGAALAGERFGTLSDPRYDIPVFSLYGSTRRPTAEMLKDLDVVVYDIQDIGVRSYTYISTLINVMEACADAGIPVVVLDRPNPIGGTVVDGPVLDPAFRSFVGIAPVPYVYGLTVGEFALMANSEGWLSNRSKCELTIVRMKGWRRSMRWRETGLTWIPTSPHVPSPEAAFANAVTGAIGELGIVSIGVGYTLPFELIGASWIDSRDFAATMNAQHIRGIYFRPTSYKPFYGMFSNMPAGSSCGGVQIIRTAETATPFTATIKLLATLRDKYPAQKLLSKVTEEKWKMFDKVCGTDSIRKQLLAGASSERIIESWRPGFNAYISKRQEYLLYE